jgi:protein-S-isoprenylcysteine O-methyltransferase Ste14
MSSVLVLRSAFWTIVAPGTVLVWVPLALLTTTSERFDLGVGRWLGLALIVLGAGGLLWCIWEFGKTGRGTLSPADAPRFVVRGGPYRYVRNPMYVSVLTVLVGEVVFLRSPWLIVWAAVVGSWFVVVARLEERRLGDQFGEPYEAYRRSVPRWIPRRPSA